MTKNGLVCWFSFIFFLLMAKKNYADSLSAYDNIDPAIGLNSFVYASVISSLFVYYYWRFRINQFVKAVKKNEKSPKEARQKYFGTFSKLIILVFTCICYYLVFIISYTLN